MSDDDASDSSSDSDDLSTNGLIATRQKRATAGNRYATLLANLDDEELQKELLADDEEGDALDYTGSDKDAGDDDEAFDSSSDEEDAGPPQEGEAEDLEGEKALKKQERAEARKKRKVHEAKLKLPAWRKATKRVKLADDVKTEDGSGVERPKKKSERSNWLPTAADMPVRQSGRATAIANRETVHANLKQSAARSEKQKRIMKKAEERLKTQKIMTGLTQEERLKKCERIERETAKEFGRWEREEAERQRLREEALAAKRNRAVDGPVVRMWSGSVLWEGEKIKVRRLEHGSQKVEEITEKEEKEAQVNESKEEEGKKVEGEESREKEKKQAEAKADDVEKKTGEALATSNTSSTHANTPADTQAKSTPEPMEISTIPSAPDTAALNTAAPKIPTATVQTQEVTAQPPVPWLPGIQDYATQPSQAPPPPSYTPSAPSLNRTVPHQPVYPSQVPQPQMYHGWPPGPPAFTVQPQHTPAPPPPPPPAPIPLIREQAQRSLLILSSFPSLETSTTQKRIPKSKLPDLTPLDPTPLTTTLLPDSHPTFTPDQRTYLLTRPRKRTIPAASGAGRTEIPLPTAPPKQRCAVTSWPAKFRDPKTGLAYADMHQYKVIQRVLMGGCAWSGVLGSWVGPRYGGLGRPAKGVPEGFAGGG